MTRSPLYRLFVQSHLLALCLGVGLGIVLFALACRHAAETEATKFGFAINSIGIGTSEEQGNFAAESSSLRLLCERGLQLRREGFRVVLWLGASQLYCIVNPKPGDKLGSFYANEAAREADARLAFLQLPAPNANLTEMLCLYLACKAQGFTPDMLVAGIVYKNLQDGGVRPQILAMIENLPRETFDSLGAEGDVLKELVEKAKAPPPDAAPTTANQDLTPADLLENSLREALGDVAPSFANRDATRTALGAWMVKKAASVLFAFSARKRPVVRVSPEMQSWNMAAFFALERVARADKVTLLTYQVPHRPGLYPFYHDRKQYDAFFTGFKAHCEAEGVGYADFELLVPPEDWGGFTQFHLPDAFHYQDEGHRRLGRAVERLCAQATGH